MTPELTPIARASHIAWAHIHYTTLEGATVAERIACTATPEVAAVLQQVAMAKASGDVAAVQTQLQTLNRTYKTALQTVRAQRREAA